MTADTATEQRYLDRELSWLAFNTRVLELADERARELYGFDLILLRPDLHVAWRGNRVPTEPMRLAALACGH
jgi:hypothetical protein